MWVRRFASDALSLATVARDATDEALEAVKDALG